MTTQLSPAQQTYLERLSAIEAEMLTALQKPSADADRLTVIMLRKMSTALQALRVAQLKEARQ